MANERGVRHRAGLRARTSLTFAALALLLSVSLALMTYGLTRRFLLSKREALATQQATVNARSVATFLGDPTIDRATILVHAASAGGSHALLRLGSRWYAPSIDVGRDAVPVELQSMSGTRIERQRFAFDGVPAVVVAVPISPDVGVYYEIFPLTELRSTLRTLALILAVAAALTTILGVFLGRFAIRRVFRPIEEMAETAVRISSGDGASRLIADDVDLAPLVHSFNDMVDALQERIEREARFAADVSHELRTPLSAIRAAVDVLERRVGEDAHQALEILRRQTHRFERLVLDLLEISRFNAGSTALVVATVDPIRLIEDVLRRAGRPDIPIVVEPTAPTSAEIDGRRIDRVLTNLIENAEHYANGATRIVVAGSRDALEIAVDDAGPGIAPEERELVFERFHRGDASRASTAPGTGLGLAIAAEQCRLHGGRLTVTDSPDGGARFLIQLPRDLPSA